MTGMCKLKKEIYMNQRGNSARRDRSSILADAKELLKKLLPAMQRMPKIERMEGAPQLMKAATCGIIECFTTAINCEEVRSEYIHRMFGHYGTLLAAFEIVISQGLLTDGQKLNMAVSIDRIGEGVKKWHRSLPASGLQAGQRAKGGKVVYPPQEACGSDKG